MRNVALTIKQFLSHPLLLIAVGAVVTNFLVPALTRSWQNHERELDIKSSVTREIATSTGDFLGTLRVVAVRSGPGGEADLDAAFGRWQVASNSVAAALGTYFPRPSLLLRWRSYQQAALYLYALFKYKTSSQRSAGLRSIGDWFPAVREGGYEQLVETPIGVADPFTSSLRRQHDAIAYLDQMNTLIDLYGRRANDISRQILREPTRL